MERMRRGRVVDPDQGLFTNSGYGTGIFLGRSGSCPNWDNTRIPKSFDEIFSFKQC
jgi:hypothetical protein